jgi:hypothetical protein
VWRAFGGARAGRNADLVTAWRWCSGLDDRHLPRGSRRAGALAPRPATGMRLAFTAASTAAWDGERNEKDR